jgi:hypothetical protein
MRLSAISWAAQAMVFLLGANSSRWSSEALQQHRLLQQEHRHQFLITQSGWAAVFRIIPTDRLQTAALQWNLQVHNARMIRRRCSGQESSGAVNSHSCTIHWVFKAQGLASGDGDVLMAAGVTTVVIGAHTDTAEALAVVGSFALQTMMLAADDSSVAPLFSAVSFDTARLTRQLHEVDIHQATTQHIVPNAEVTKIASTPVALNCRSWFVYRSHWYSFDWLKNAEAGTLVMDPQSV